MAQQSRTGEGEPRSSSQRVLILYFTKKGEATPGTGRGKSACPLEVKDIPREEVEKHLGHSLTNGQGRSSSPFAHLWERDHLKLTHEDRERDCSEEGKGMARGLKK